MTPRLHARTVTEAVDRADQRHWTRQLPRSDRARLQFLLRKEHGDPQALAARLGIPPATLHAIAERRRLPDDSPVRALLEREVIKHWQPVVRRRAHQVIREHNGQVSVSFRAWFGFTSAVGTTDDPRLRFLTVVLQPPYGTLLLDARDRDASEAELHGILGEALAASYFHRQQQPAALEKVTLKDIDYLEFFF